MAAAPALPPLPTPATRSPLVLALAVALPLLAACAPRDLWAPDEPRYGLVARTMLEAGDPLVPRINGQPYAEKPPLVFAVTAGVGALVGGVTSFVARLVGALFAAFATWRTARLARRWFGDAGLGDTAALLFATSALVLWNGARAGLDLPLTACALVALEAATVVVARGSTRAALAMGAALAAGLLTKGPHALYVPVCALVGGCLASGAGRRLRDPRFALALVVAVALAAAWAIPAIAHAGDGPAYHSDVAFGRRLFGQLGSRAAGEDEPHVHGPLYLVALLAAFGLPWTPAWVLGLVRAARPSRTPAEDRFGLGAAVWGVLGPLVLLSIPATKRELYLIPLLPAASILGAYALHRLAGARYARNAARGLVGSGLLLAAVALAAPFLATSAWVLPDPDDRVVARTLSEGAVATALAAAAVLLATGAFGMRRLATRAASAARAFGVALGAAALVVLLVVVPAFDPWKSFASAARVGAAARPTAGLAIWGFSDMSVLWSFPHRRLDHLGVHTYDEAAAALAPDAPPVLVLAREKVWRERDRRAAPAARAVFDGVRVLWTRPVGGTAYVLLTNGGA